VTSDVATSDWGKDREREGEKASRAREQRQRRLRTTTTNDDASFVVEVLDHHPRPDPGAVRS
jgi:hypothetical protein